MAAAAGRTVLITGATSGLGRYLAERLAAAGDSVILHGRDEERARGVCDEIERASGYRPQIVLADLAELGQVLRLAEEVTERVPRLDALINNAGIGFGPPGAGREVSADGIELRFAVNYLAGRLLTLALLPRLLASAPAAVINVASAGQYPIDFADPLLEAEYDGTRAYRQSKLAQIMFTFDLAEHLRDRRVAVNALHPATFMETAMVKEAGISGQSTVQEGGEAVLALLNDEHGRTGRYMNGTWEDRALAQAYDPEARRRLRELSDELLRRAGAPVPLDRHSS